MRTNARSAGAALAVGLLLAAVPVTAGDLALPVAVDADSALAAGISHNRSGRHHLAAEALEQARRARPDDIEVLSALALAYSKIGCFQDAAEEYRRIAELSPGDLDARFRLSYAYSRLDWHTLAAETFRDMVMLVCDESLGSEGGCSSVTSDLIDDMIESYRRYVWNDNGEADLHYQRGLAYLMLARGDLAYKEYRALKKRDPYLAAGLYRLLRN